MTGRKSLEDNADAAIATRRTGQEIGTRKAGCAAMLATPQPLASLRRCNSKANIRQASFDWP